MASFSPLLTLTAAGVSLETSATTIQIATCKITEAVGGRVLTVDNLKVTDTNQTVAGIIAVAARVTFAVGEVRPTGNLNFSLTTSTGVILATGTAPALPKYAYPNKAKTECTYILRFKSAKPTAYNKPGESVKAIGTGVLACVVRQAWGSLGRYFGAMSPSDEGSYVVGAQRQGPMLTKLDVENPQGYYTTLSRTYFETQSLIEIYNKLNVEGIIYEILENSQKYIRVRSASGLWSTDAMYSLISGETNFPYACGSILSNNAEKLPLVGSAPFPERAFVHQGIMDFVEIKGNFQEISVVRKYIDNYRTDEVGTYNEYTGVRFTLPGVMEDYKSVTSTSVHQIDVVFTDGLSMSDEGKPCIHYVCGPGAGGLGSVKQIGVFRVKIVRTNPVAGGPDLSYDQMLMAVCTAYDRPSL